MNLCILIGKIVSNIEFYFVYKSKHIAIIIFYIKVDNCNIKVKAYDEIADWCYQNLEKNDIVAIEGSIDNKEVIVNNIEIIQR